MLPGIAPSTPLGQLCRDQGTGLIKERVNQRFKVNKVFFLRVFKINKSHPGMVHTGVILGGVSLPAGDSAHL